MIRTLKLALLTLVLAAGLNAQTTTTYTGTIKDLTQNPVTSGQVTFTLAPPVDSTLPGVGRFTPSTVLCNINVDGTLSTAAGGACMVTMNTALTPSGTSYRICIQPNYVAPGSCFYDYALSSTKDLTTIVPTLSTGPQNYSGIPGPSTNISLGPVITGPTNTPASATMTGVSPNQTLNLVLPIGPAGGSLSYPGVTADGASGMKIAGTLAAGTTNSGTVNGVVNPTLFPGADIGAKTNAALASCPANCKVVIPPGTYNLSTTIALAGTNVTLSGPGVTLVSIAGTVMMTVGGDRATVEGVTFNLNGVAGWAMVVSGSNSTIQNNQFVGTGSYGVYANYAGDGLAILNNKFAAGSTGRGMGPIAVQFTSHFRVIGNHMYNTGGFGITMLASSYGVVSGNTFSEPAFQQTIVATASQTSFAFTLPSFATTTGVHINGATTTPTSTANTGGNNWTVTLPAQSAGTVVTLLGWQGLEDIQVNSLSFNIAITGNSLDGSGDSAIDVVSDYGSTVLSTVTATINQTVFNFTGTVTFFDGLMVNGRLLTGSDLTPAGIVNTSGSNYTATLVTPQPPGTVVSFVNIGIGTGVGPLLPSQIVISDNTIRHASAAGIGLDSNAPNTIITSNVIEDCAQASTDTSYSSGVYVASAQNVSVKNNLIVNTTVVPSMHFGISVNNTVADTGSLDKAIKIGGNVFSGTFQSKVWVFTQTPTQRQWGVDVDGPTIAYPESVNTDSAWTTTPSNTSYFGYTTGITLVRDTTNVMGGTASIGYPGNGGNGGLYAQINLNDTSLLTSSILKINWWAKLNSGVMGFQVWTWAAGNAGVQEVDASGTGWKHYSVYVSTVGLDMTGGIFLRLVGAGTGNFQNISVATTPLDSPDVAANMVSRTTITPPATSLAATQPMVENISVSGVYAGVGGGGTPQETFINAAAALDMKSSNTYTDASGILHGRLVNDSLSQVNDWFTLTRSGYVPVSLTFPEPVLMKTGSTVNGSPIPVVGTPTVGQAACIKAAGPPVVLGYCSTVVSSTGSCTCN